jgi:hypothetical protein
MVAQFKEIKRQSAWAAGNRGLSVGWRRPEPCGAAAHNIPPQIDGPTLEHLYLATALSVAIYAAFFVTVFARPIFGGALYDENGYLPFKPPVGPQLALGCERHWIYDPFHDHAGGHHCCACRVAQLLASANLASDTVTRYTTVARLNIKLFCKKLSEEMNETRRQTLPQLLAEERKNFCAVAVDYDLNLGKAKSTGECSCTQFAALGNDDQTHDLPYGGDCRGVTKRAPRIGKVGPSYGRKPQHTVLPLPL